MKLKDKFTLIRCPFCGANHSCQYGNRIMTCDGCQQQICFYTDHLEVIERACPDCIEKLKKRRGG